MEFGREIAVNGVRPGWLGKNADPLGYKRINGCWYGPSEEQPAIWTEADIFSNQKNWSTVTHIRLPADHWVYRVLDWNDAHPDQEPFEPWAGGDAAPEDWDQGDVLRYWRPENVEVTVVMGPNAWDGKDGGAIGYRRKRTAAAQPDMVRLRRMGGVEAREYARNITGLIPASHFLDDIVRVLHALGIVEPTEAERIAQATGLTVDVVQKVLEARDAS